MKAIASGNPAVLTLAESDSEIRRLLVLRKHHADEQYLARKSSRELPETIARLKVRLEETTADHETAKAHAGEPAVVGGSERRPEAVFAALSEAMRDLPEEAFETRRVALGRMRGFRFGLVMRRAFLPEVYLEGRGARLVQLSRDARGPRAVLNALNRLFEGSPGKLAEILRELSLAEARLDGYRARLGAAFPHERYVDELSGLRDELQAVLSASGTEEAKTRPAGSDAASAGADSVRAAGRGSLGRPGTPLRARPDRWGRRGEGAAARNGGLAVEPGLRPQYVSEAAVLNRR
ncbi:hypothetical protein [Paludisphaera sp.]|uniref:hypothetical protein n=1 Tax=Paludisphaera sp. TaxID=2017432 RepID=UPI00301BA428